MPKDQANPGPHWACNRTNTALKNLESKQTRHAQVGERDITRQQRDSTPQSSNNTIFFGGEWVYLGWDQLNRKKEKEKSSEEAWEKRMREAGEGKLR